MYTRNDYMNGKCTHDEYYSQFVSTGIIDLVSNRIGVKNIKNSGDEHFNDIPLARWDALIGYSERARRPNTALGLSIKFKQAGESATASTLVCVLKQAAKQIKSRD